MRWCRFIALFGSMTMTATADDPPKTGERLARRGDEIMVCGQLYHTTARGRPLVRSRRLRRLSAGAEVRSPRPGGRAAPRKAGQAARQPLRPAAQGIDRGGGRARFGEGDGTSPCSRRSSTSSSSTSTRGEPAGGASRCSTMSAV